MPMLDEVPAGKGSRLLAHCVTKWRLILNRYHSEQSAQTPEDDEIEACFGTRSVRTIAKRANSCLSFLRWFDVMGPMHLRPFCDEGSWSYIGFVRRSGAGASCASAFLSSMRFCRYVMGMDKVELLLRRCVGAAEQMLSCASLVSPASALSADEVWKLHQVLDSDDTPEWDRALCAFVLICLYGRCRQSDLAMVDHILWEVSEGGELGCEGLITRFHKTSRSTAKKARLLPIMVHVAGVYEKPWVWQANEAFQAVGLTLEGEIKGPLFRPPSMQGEGKLCERGISAEVSRFLRLSVGCANALEPEGLLAQLEKNVPLLT